MQRILRPTTRCHSTAAELKSSRLRSLLGSLRTEISEGVHHGFAQPVDRDHRALAARDRNRRNQAAGNYQHPGFQITAALGEMIGEPRKRRTRILSSTLADHFAAQPFQQFSTINERTSVCV